MARTVVSYAFLNQPNGQICVVKVHDSNTNRHKFRACFISQNTGGITIEDDVKTAVQWGAELPEVVGEVFLRELGEDCFIEIT